ncbi:MAG TPA: lipoyl(octanoyl) transferase LipB [Candidatus Binataceae bacterium]
MTAARAVAAERMESMLPVRKLLVANLGQADYSSALELQMRIVAARHADAIADTILLLEHPHVYTLGRGADERLILASLPGVPIHRVSRGGQVTYHGPGQLIGYPILKLEGPMRDVTGYLRRLEQVMIDALGSFAISATRREKFTGVWTGSANASKIASIGVGIRRWVTYHGFAINVATDLSYFDAIVPCGIAGCEMTSVAKLGRPDITVDAFATSIAESFARNFDYAEVARLEATALASMLDTQQENSQAPSLNDG